MAFVDSTVDIETKARGGIGKALKRAVLGRKAFFMNTFDGPGKIVSGKLDITDNYCGSCSEVFGEDTDCRTFEYKGKTSENMPKEMLREGLLKVLSQYDNSS